MRITLRVNGAEHALEVEPRRLLADVLRQELGLFGVHLGCEHGVCGACTVLLDGEPVRSCLMFAPQAEGREIGTVEGTEASPLHEAVRDGFKQAHGLQCGFCTPALVLSAAELVAEVAEQSEEDIREALAGNICRCTGYANIVDAVRRAAAAYHGVGDDA